MGKGSKKNTIEVLMEIMGWLWLWKYAIPSV